MPPKRTSNRIRKQKSGRAVTPASLPRTRNGGRRNTTKASSKGSRRSLPTRKATPVASIARLRNPYKKKSRPKDPSQVSHTGSVVPTRGIEAPPISASPSVASVPPTEVGPLNPPPPPAAASLLRSTASPPQVVQPAVHHPVPSAQPCIPPLITNDNNGVIGLSSVPRTSVFTLTGILQSIALNPITLGPKDVAMDTLAVTSNKHMKRCSQQEHNFFCALANHPQAHPLAEMIDDPLMPHKKNYRFYILCRAPNGADKHAMINWAVLIYSMVMVKVEFRNEDLSKDPARFAKAQYQPGCVLLNIKCLFTKFRKNEIYYQQGTDFNGRGKCLVCVRFVCQWTTLLSCSVC